MDTSLDAMLTNVENQHARLSRFFDEISTVALVPNGHPVLSVLLEGMHDLLLTHFRDEESFMARIGYPNMSGHKWQHDTIARDIEALLAVGESGCQSLSIEHLHSLRALVQDHATDNDADVVSYYHANICIATG